MTRQAAALDPAERQRMFADVQRTACRAGAGAQLCHAARVRQHQHARDRRARGGAAPAGAVGRGRNHASRAVPYVPAPGDCPYDAGVHGRRGALVRFLTRRLLSAVVVVFVVASATLVLSAAADGDYFSIALGFGRVAAQRRASARAALGFDRPVSAIYLAWLTRAARLDFGTSLTYQRPVGPLVAERAAKTALLAVAALAIVTLLGVPLGHADRQPPGARGAPSSRAALERVPLGAAADCGDPARGRRRVHGHPAHRRDDDAVSGTRRDGSSGHETSRGTCRCRRSRWRSRSRPCSSVCSRRRSPRRSRSRR